MEPYIYVGSGADRFHHNVLSFAQSTSCVCVPTGSAHWWAFIVIAPPSALIGPCDGLLTITFESQQNRGGCEMDLQQIIPGTLKQGYLTKSPPLDKGGIKVRSCVLTEPLTRVARSGGRWLWFK